MYLTPYQKKQLITVVILVLGIPLTLFAIYKGVQWFTSAGADTQPQDVILANITTNSATLTWTTNTKVTGSVVPVLNNKDQSPVIDKRGNRKGYTHYVELKSLEPNTEYSFKLISGGDTYSNTDGKGFSFETAKFSADTPTPTPIHGELEGVGDDDLLIYAFTKDKSTYPVATVPLSNGNWLVDLSALRRISDNSMYMISDSANLVIIAVSGVDTGGLVEGSYSTIFDSSGKLTENLSSSGSLYDEHIPQEAKLVAMEEETEEEEEVVVPTIPDNDEDTDDNYSPPVTEDDTFDRDYELRADLVWTNLVTSEGTISGSPEVYGEESVMVTNLTDVSMSIIWYSKTEETGFVMYGTSETSLTEKGRDERDGISSGGEYYLHSIEIIRLEPETTYYYEIHSGEDVYDNNGNPYEVTTFATQSSPPQFDTIAGNMNAQDYESVIVVATFSDEDEVGSSGSSYPLSTLVDSEGSWILTIGGARDEEGGYFDKSDDDQVTFATRYFSNPSPVELTVGNAKLNEVELSATGTSSSLFTRIPFLPDYGILSD